LRHQLARYAIAGGGVYVADLTAYCLVVLVDPELYLLANCAGRLTGATVGFIAHRRWTFGAARESGWRRQLLLYAALLATNLLVSSFLLWLLVSGLGLANFPSRVGVDSLLLALTFLVLRHWVFGARRC
jgi:putative flippase GtrA